MKKYLFNVIVSTVSIFLTLLVIEINLKLSYTKVGIPWNFAFNEVRKFIPDKELIYKPNSLEYDIYNLEKIDKWQKANTRVLAIGDSFTFGSGVDKKSSYPRILESILKKTDSSIEVINAGVPGYGTDQEIFFLQNELLDKLQPDIVIWNINANDPSDNIERPIFTIVNNSLRYIGGWRNWLYLQGVIYKVTPKFLRKTYLANFVLQKIQQQRISRLAPINKEERWLWSQNKISLEIDKFYQLSKKKNFTPIVVFVLNQAVMSKNTNNTQAQAIIEFIEFVKLEAEKRGVEFIDVNKKAKNLLAKSTSSSKSSILGVTNPSEPLFLDESHLVGFGWYHPNINGHNTTAVIVAQQLTYRKIFP